MTLQQSGQARSLLPQRARMFRLRRNGARRREERSATPAPRTTASAETERISLSVPKYEVQSSEQTSRLVGATSKLAPVMRGRTASHPVVGNDDRERVRFPFPVLG